MNTGKQVNAMIVLLFVLIAVLFAYLVNENTRQVNAREELTERNAERGARLFVANCRSCHGLEGLGPEDSPPGVGAKLNAPAFLVISGGNVERVAREYRAGELALTPKAEADTIRAFLRDTITCGRRGTAMPAWAERFQGPLSDTQVEQLVTLITEGRWDLVAEQGEEIDRETGLTPADIVVADPSQLSIVQDNCGQYTGLTALPFRTRDPFAAAGAEPTETPPPGGGGTVRGLPVAEFFAVSCAVCHGQNREGGVGPSLTPARLTESDDLYFETIKNGRPGTAMPSWGAQGLSDDDIRTLVEFITTVEP